MFVKSLGVVTENSSQSNDEEQANDYEMLLSVKWIQRPFQNM